jgi:hypothetical protein
MPPHNPETVTGQALTDYTDAVVEAVGDRTDIGLVAQSMGAFITPPVRQRRSTSLIIFRAW